MATAELERNTIENIGPIERVVVPDPPEGGIVVFRGRNGLGKSKALETIGAALSGTGGLEVRDRAIKGEAELFGIRLTVGKSTRRTGELEVATLDSRFDISKLIDPGIKSPEAADAERVRQIVRLTGVAADPALFYGLAGGQEKFEEICKARPEVDDVVALAAAIKRDFEAAARKEEDRAEQADGRCRGARESINGIDITGDSDGDKLQAALESAIKVEASLKSKADAAEDAEFAAKKAKEALIAAEKEYTGPTLEEAIKSEQEAEAVLDQCAATIEKLRAQLASAEAEHKLLDERRKSAADARRAAEHHEATITEWRETLNAALPQPISPDELAQASANVAEARAAVERGVLIRKAKEQLAKAEEADAQARAHRKQADKLRAAAKGTDDVLTELLAKSGCPLRFEQGRIVVSHDRRANGFACFGELSAGERARIAIDVALPALQENKGRMVLQQDLWEGLDPLNRRELLEHATKRGVTIYTAEATDDAELTAEVYDGT